MHIPTIPPYTHHSTIIISHHIPTIPPLLFQTYTHHPRHHIPYTHHTPHTTVSILTSPLARINYPLILYGPAYLRLYFILQRFNLLISLINGSLSNSAISWRTSFRFSSNFLSRSATRFFSSSISLLSCTLGWFKPRGLHWC